MWDKIIIFPRRIPARLLLLAQSFSYVSLAIDLSSRSSKKRQNRDTATGEAIVKIEAFLNIAIRERLLAM